MELNPTFLKRIGGKIQQILISESSLDFCSFEHDIIGDKLEELLRIMTTKSKHQGFNLYVAKNDGADRVCVLSLPVLQRLNWTSKNPSHDQTQPFPNYAKFVPDLYFKLNLE